jgi:hypothetical protein
MARIESGMTSGRSHGRAQQRFLDLAYNISLTEQGSGLVVYTETSELSRTVQCDWQSQPGIMSPALRVQAVFKGARIAASPMKKYLTPTLQFATFELTDEGIGLTVRVDDDPDSYEDRGSRDMLAEAQAYFVHPHDVCIEAINARRPAPVDRPPVIINDRRAVRLPGLFS